MKNGKEKSMFVREYLWRDLMTVCGLFVILLTIVIGAFLVYKGSSTFLVYRHSFLEFLGSADWAPEDNMAGGGSIGALIFIVGSLCTCGLALLIATPFSLGSAIFITEISPKFGEKFYRPVVEIFAGIPSVVYGFFGLVVIVPMIRDFGKWMKMMGLVEKSGDGKGVLTTSIILGMMILPTIIGTTESAMRAVPEQYYEGALALGATHERSIFTVIIPAAKSGVIAGIVLGIGRAIGETMAVIMIVGNQPRLVSNMLLGMRTLTGNIVIEMGYATGLHREALIATGVVLFVFILIINFSVALLKRRGEHE